MWFDIENNSDLIRFTEKYPSYKLPKFKIGESVKIYYNFEEFDYYLGEPCLKGIILYSYCEPIKNIYEHLKSFNKFNNKL